MMNDKRDHVKAEVAGAMLPAIDALINHTNKIIEIIHHDCEELSCMDKDTDTLGSVILSGASEIKENAQQIKMNLRNHVYRA